MLLASFHDRLILARRSFMHNSADRFDLKHKTTGRADAAWYFSFCTHSSLNRSRTRILLRLDSDNSSTLASNKMRTSSLFLVGFDCEKLSFLGRVHEWAVLPLRIASIQLIDCAKFDLVH